MASKKQSSSQKHLDFVALLRSSMHIPEKKVSPTTVTSDNNAENEVDSELMRELEKKFDELFGAVD